MSEGDYISVEIKNLINHTFLLSVGEIVPNSEVVVWNASAVVVVVIVVEATVVVEGASEEVTEAGAWVLVLAEAAVNTSRMIKRHCRDTF